MKRKPTTHDPPAWARLPDRIADIERQRRPEPSPRDESWLQRVMRVRGRERQKGLFSDG